MDTLRHCGRGMADDEGMMENDSLDISQLKVLALEFHDEAMLQPKNNYSQAISPESLGGKQPSPKSNRETRRGQHEARQFEQASQASSQQHPRRVARQSPTSQPELSRNIHNAAKRVEMSGESQKSGATDPLSQWLVDDFTKSRSELGSRLRIVDGTEEGTVVTYTQGQTGHIDLLRHFHDIPEDFIAPPAQPSPEDEQYAEAGLFSQQPDVQAEMFPESRRFLQPQTPATTSKKRDARGNPVEHVFTTPALPVNPFGSTGKAVGIMNLSQVFRATQAASSPLLNIPTSDGLSERPSPHLLSIQRPFTAYSMSSPAKLPRADLRPRTAEPQAHYISMEESQAERERRLGLLTTSSPARQRERAASVSDDDFDQESDQVVRHHRRKNLEQLARNELSGVRTRSISETIHTIEKKQTTWRNTRLNAYATGYTNQSALLISDDADVNVDVDVEEIPEDDTDEETEQEGVNLETESSDELGEENKENVDVRHVQVPDTIARPRMKIFATRSAKTSRLHLPSAKQDDEADELVHLPLLAPSSQKIIEPRGGQVIAVADSQASQTSLLSDGRALQAEGNGLLSSGSSRKVVPQSQLSRLPRTSQIDSSIARGMLNSVSHQVHIANAPNVTVMGQMNAEQSSPEVRRSPRNKTTAPLHAEMVKNVVQANLLPSSPPALAAPEDPVDCSLERPGATRTQTEPSTMKSPRLVLQPQSKAQEMVIQDSARADTRINAKHPSRPPASRTSTQFATAPLHHSASPTRASRRPCQAVSARNSPASRKTKRPRAFMDIAQNPSPLDELGDIDVDINLMTKDDLSYQAQMRLVEDSSPIGPVRKRRRMRSENTLTTVKPDISTCPDLQVPSSSLSSLSSHASILSVHDVDGFAIDGTLSQKCGGRSEDVESVSRPEGSALKGRSALADQSIGISPLYTSNLTNPVPAPRNLQSGDKREQSISSAEEDQAQAQKETLSKSSVKMSNRVLAYFNGSGANYYPATCIGVTAGDVGKLKIRFDDGICGNVPSHMVKAFDMRAGDIVKVDRKGHRGNNYIVLGFEKDETAAAADATNVDLHSPSTHPTQYPLTDVYGHSKIVLALHSKNEVSGEHLEVSTAELYMTTTQWSALKDRPYTYRPPHIQQDSGLHTPLDRPSTPTTPSTRTRRTLSIIKHNDMANSGIVAPRAVSRIFSNMVFALTAISDSSTRSRLEQVIEVNGGHILNDGFNELFETPQLTPLTPSKRFATPMAQTGMFRLKPGNADFGFTALITDNHCRQAKYFQALALGIPCLATRWIFDCIRARAVLPWQPYLLAAGESAFLDGAIKSRSLPFNDPEQVRLSQILQQRPKWLQGKNVLLVLSKATEVRMKPQQFLAYALGAKKVVCASDLAAARAVLLENARTVQEPFAWVCYHGSEKKDQGELSVKSVEELLFDSEYDPKGRKGGKDLVNKGETKVVVAEFVMQSLILGSLLEMF